MKKIILIAIALMLGISLASARDRVVRDVNVLPQPARTTLTSHFKKTPVNHIKIDKGVFDTDYEVILNNGTEIDFDKDGNWTEIDCGMNAVPAGLILKPISDYVAKFYKGQKIIAIDKESRSYDVTLSNGIELKFDRSGKFLKIDD